jgi:hypothetical protein
MSLVILMIKALVAQSVKARLAGGLTDIDDELRPMTHSQPIFAAKNQSSDVAGALQELNLPDLTDTGEAKRKHIVSKEEFERSTVEMVIHSGKPIVQIGRELGVKRSQSACLWGTVAWLIAYSLLTPRPYIPRCHPINPFPLLAQQPSHQAAGFKTVVDPPTWLSEEERRREGVPHRVAREVEPLQLIPLSRPVVARKGRPITQCPMHSVGSPPQGVVEQAQNSRPGAPFSKCDAQPAANLLFSRVTSGNISISSAHSRWSSGS